MMRVVAQVMRVANPEPEATGMFPKDGLLWFIGGCVILFGLLGFLLRGMFSALAQSATEHASRYAMAYAKGSALILIAMIASFQETWGMITLSDVRHWQWWDYFIALTKPFAAGLAVLVAFLDRSLPDPRNSSNTTTPPFPPSKP